MDVNTRDTMKTCGRDKGEVGGGGVGGEGWGVGVGGGRGGGVAQLRSMMLVWQQQKNGRIGRWCMGVTNKNGSTEI